LLDPSLVDPGSTLIYVGAYCPKSGDLTLSDVDDIGRNLTYL